MTVIRLYYDYIVIITRKEMRQRSFTLIRLLILVVIAIAAASAGALAQGQPANKPGASLSPTVSIEKVTVDDVPHSVIGTSVLDLGPGRHRVEFQYTAPGFDTSEQIRFRFRLQGLDLGWVDSGERRRALYSNLPPGRYLFQVTACNANGIWNPAGASIGLMISPYFWQTRLFMGLFGVILLALVWACVRLMVKRR